MKNLILVLILVTSAFAQEQMQDVVYLKDGSILRGQILELVPGAALRIQTKGGSIFVLKMENVEKITKEKELNTSDSPPAPPEKTPEPSQPGIDTTLARARADSASRAIDEAEKEAAKKERRRYFGVGGGLVIFPSNSPSSAAPSGEAKGAYDVETVRTGSGWNWLLSFNTFEYKTTKTVKNGTVKSYSRREYSSEGYTHSWPDSLRFQYGLSRFASLSVGYRLEASKPPLKGCGAGVFVGYVIIQDVFFRMKTIYDYPNAGPPDEYEVDGERFAIVESEQKEGFLAGVEGTVPLSEEPRCVLFWNVKKMFITHDFEWDKPIPKLDLGLLQLSVGIAAGY